MAKKSKRRAKKTATRRAPTIKAQTKRLQPVERLIRDLRRVIDKFEA